jgi:hypothetical protein
VSTRVSRLSKGGKVFVLYTLYIHIHYKRYHEREPTLILRMAGLGLSYCFRDFPPSQCRSFLSRLGY